MKLKTKIFTLYREEYRNLAELSRAMEIPESHINQVMEGSGQIGQAFITGVHKAFPDRNLCGMFFLVSEIPTTVSKERSLEDAKQ